MTFVYFVRSKKEVQITIKQFIALSERQTGKALKRLRSDNGGEYTSDSLKEFLDKKGIIHERSAPYTPQQNGTAERSNRILIEKARCMLQKNKLTIKVWAEAVSTAAYLRNVTPTATLKWMTPFGFYHGRAPDVSHLKVLGCRAQVFIPPFRREKWSATSERCIFIGYNETARIHKLYSISRKRVTTSAHAKFYENEPGWIHQETGWTRHPSSSTPQTIHISDLIEDHQKTENNLNSSDNHPVQQLSTQPSTATPSISIHSQPQHSQDTTPQQTTSQTVQQQPIQPPANGGPSTAPCQEYLTRSGRVTRAPTKLTYDQCITDDEDADVATMDTAIEPQSYREAIESTDRSHWMEAMSEEMNALNLNETWDLVEQKPEQKVIKCRWVYATKNSSHGDQPKYKARLVAKGFNQSYGIDYFETFAPVARMSSIRLLLAIAVQTGSHIHQMDVRNAFLNGALKEDVFMKQPEGFVSSQYPTRVCKLKRSLYGLKQAAREWYLTITSFLEGIGFTTAKPDQAIYFGIIDGHKVWLILYVDDMLVISTAGSEEAEKLK